MITNQRNERYWTEIFVLDLSLDTPEEL